MTITDLFLAQLTDPFRIGITIALMLTMLRTRQETGTVKPLALGVAFIAVLIPLTIHPGQASLPVAVAMGLVTTSVILAAALAVRTLVLRAMGR